MASDRQIAANRRNARKSTGPRSHCGKKRAARNAYRHGLCLRVSSTPAFAPEVERLARYIAGDSNDEAKLQFARAIEAVLDLERVRRAKVSLIQRAHALGALDSESPQFFSGSAREHMRVLKKLLLGLAPLPESIDPAATMPAQEPERSAEAIRRALPELLRFDRYERRASSRRDQTVRDICQANAKSSIDS